MNINPFSYLSYLFPPPAPLGTLKLYQTKSNKWRWKVLDADGKTIVNPIKSFKTGAEARKSFDETRAIIESVV